MAETYPRFNVDVWRLLMQEISQGNREPHVLQAFRELEGDRLRHVALPLCAGYESCHSRTVPAMMRGAIPQAVPVFWSFRIMVGCGSLLLLVMLIALCPDAAWQNRPASLVLKMALWSSLPLPDCD